MKTFSVMLAQSVRVYGTTEVEAESFEAAVEKIRAEAEATSGPVDQRGVIWDCVTDVDWSTTHEEAVVSIEDEESGEAFGCIPLVKDTDPDAITSKETLRLELIAQGHIKAEDAA